MRVRTVGTPVIQFVICERRLKLESPADIPSRILQGRVAVTFPERMCLSVPRVA